MNFIHQNNPNLCTFGYSGAKNFLHQNNPNPCTSDKSGAKIL